MIKLKAFLLSLVLVIATLALLNRRLMIIIKSRITVFVIAPRMKSIKVEIF